VVAALEAYATPPTQFQTLALFHLPRTLLAAESIKALLFFIHAIVIIPATAGALYQLLT
jgi:hypothetical protein